MSDSQEQRRLIAAVTLILPNRKTGKGWMAGKVVKAKQEIPTQGLDPTYIDQWVKSGSAFWEGNVPQLRDVKALRNDDDKVNVSSVTDEPDKDTLDKGIDLVAGDKDPALASKLDEIAAEQAGEGVEDDNSEDEPKAVEVNAETGEVIETGGEMEFDEEEEADARVS